MRRMSITFLLTSKSKNAVLCFIALLLLAGHYAFVRNEPDIAGGFKRSLLESQVITYLQFFLLVSSNSQDQGKTKDGTGLSNQQPGGCHLNLIRLFN